MADNNLLVVTTKEEWEEFVKGELTAYMTTKGIEKITVDNGSGFKAKISRTAKGEIKTDISYVELM